MFFDKKTAKRIVSFSAAAVCMISALKISPLAVETNAAGTMTPFEITEDMEIGWNVGNSLDSTGYKGTDIMGYEQAWGNPAVTQELIDTAKAKGFNTIRVPVTWYEHLDDSNTIDPAWLARVKEVVDYAYNQDMYVILNVHHEEWINRADLATAYDEMSAKLTRIWEQIASYFKDYDQHLIFEGMNEPRAAGTDHEWGYGVSDAEFDVINKLGADFVNTVRSIDSPYKDTRLLMVPCYCASCDVNVYENLVVPDDDYIAVSLHAYSPYNFAMNSEMPSHEFTDAYKTELNAILTNMRNTYIDKDIPVIIGEFGTSNFNNTEDRCEWAEYYIGTAKKYGIPCVLWDNNCDVNPLNTGEAHGYINRSNNTWYSASEPVVDTMMKVINDSSIVWGSEKKAPVYTHPDIDSGKVLDPTGKALDASTDNNCSDAKAATSDMIKGKDIAVQYTGDTPVLAGMDSAWGNWTEFSSPYDIDEEKGIAYFSGDDYAAMWTSAELASILVRTNGKTNLTKIAIIDKGTLVETEEPTTDAPTDEPTDAPTDKPTSPIVEPTDAPTDNPTDEPKFETKIYKLDLSDRTESQQVFANLEGTPNAYVNGCVGYSIGEDWFAVKWETELNKNGEAQIAVDISEIPMDVKSAEFQIWWASVGEEVVECEASSVNLVSKPGPVVIYGDTDDSGKVNLADAVSIISYLADASRYPLDEAAIDRSDVENRGDGINSADAIAIQKFLLGDIKSLPASYMTVQ